MPALYRILHDTAPPNDTRCEVIADVDEYNARRRALWRRGELGIPGVHGVMADIDDEFVWTVRPNGLWTLPEDTDHVRLTVAPMGGQVRVSGVTVDTAGVVYGTHELLGAWRVPVPAASPVFAGDVRLGDRLIPARTTDLLFLDTTGQRLVLVEVLRTNPRRDGDDTWLITTC